MADHSISPRRDATPAQLDVCLMGSDAATASGGLHPPRRGAKAPTFRPRSQTLRPIGALETFGRGAGGLS